CRRACIWWEPSTTFVRPTRVCCKTSRRAPRDGGRLDRACLERGPTAGLPDRAPAVRGSEAAGASAGEEGTTTTQGSRRTCHRLMWCYHLCNLWILLERDSLPYTFSVGAKSPYAQQNWNR